MQPSTPPKRFSEFSLPLHWHLYGSMEQGMLLERRLASLCVGIGLVVHHEALNDHPAPLGMAHSTESLMVTKRLID